MKILQKVKKIVSELCCIIHDLPGCLAQSFVVGLDVVDDDSPLAVGVERAQRLNVSRLGGAEVLLVLEMCEAVNGVLGRGQHILVEKCSFMNG